MEWLIAAATGLGSLLTTAAVVFRRSLKKGLEAGRARVKHSAVDNQRIIIEAERFRNTETRALPRLKMEVESIERGGGVIREAENLRERRRAAEEEARRAAQSFTTNLDREEGGLARLREAGLLIDSPTGPILDTSRIRPEARKTAAKVGVDIPELAWFRTHGQEEGIGGPLKAPPFTEKDVAEITRNASRPNRIDKDQIRRDEYRARGLDTGHGPLADSPASLAEAVRGRTGPARRISVASARGADGHTPGRSR
jgi:hypothetical protein